MPTSQIYHFAEYRLDSLNACLHKHNQTIPLPPKALTMLAYLIERRGRLVTKDELLEAVWEGRYVSEGVLKTTMQLLRQALDDDPKAPRFLETVHRRGYRFRDDAPANPPSMSPSKPIDNKTSVLIVGREVLLEQLEQHLAEAVSGRSATVLLSGEPGIGKTALIQAFVESARSRVPSVQGQCMAQFGQGEPYLPLLDAVNQLAKQTGEDCVRQLRQYAPTWLAQLPWLLGDDRDGLQRETQGATKGRMLRELGEFLKVISQARPLILVVEDLHWSDHATLDAVNYLARRKDGLRLMILGSYRPADIDNDHPFKIIRDELLLHELCKDLPLTLLGGEDVRRYLQQRFAAESVTDSLAEAVHRRTEGLPLFMRHIAEEMAVADPEHFEQALTLLPAGLKHSIERRFDLLTPIEKDWLDIAAVCGDSFSAAALAGLTATRVLDVEAWCEQPARGSHLLRRADSHSHFCMPGVEDYAFIHAYYRELAYARIAPMRRAALHCQVGDWLESVYGGVNELAAELAVHYERGHQYARAVQYFYQAARNAMNRHAAREAAQLLQRGIALLDTHWSDGLEQQRQRLDFLAVLPAVLVSTRGYGVAELPALYDRALSLARQLEDGQAQFFTLYRVWMFNCSTGKLATAHELTNQLFNLAENMQEPSKLLAACFARGSTLYHMGDNPEADRWFARGQAFAEALGAEGDRLSLLFGEDLHVLLLALHALTRHMLGQAQSGLALMRAAITRAETIGHPYSHAAALICASWLRRDRGEPERAQECLPQLEHLAVSHGFPFIIYITRIIKGWGAALTEGDAQGLEDMGEALAQMSATGSRVTRPIYLHQTAEACLRLGRYAEGVQAVDAALAEIALTGERRYEAESWLLRGELSRRWHGAGDGGPRQCFERALATAVSQQSRIFELRATCALLRTVADTAQQNTFRQRLARLCRQFEVEGETPDLIMARALLSAGPAG